MKSVGDTTPVGKGGKAQISANSGDAAAESASPPAADELPSAESRPTTANAPLSDQTPSASVWVRGLKTLQGGAKQFKGQDLRTALGEAVRWKECAQPEPVASWSDRTKLCALDVDCHDDGKLSEIDVVRLMGSQCPILPSIWWPTHGGGLRWVYAAVAYEGLTINADEVAALAGVLLWQKRRAVNIPVTGFELKTETRLPHYARADGSTAGAPGFNDPPSVYTLMHAAGRLFGRYDEADDDNLDDEDVEEAKRMHGLPDGPRVSHAYCLSHPTPNDDKNNAVVILSRGVYCHSCAAAGRVYPGCFKPGWVPFSRLVDPAGGSVYVSSDVAAMARRGTHWEHARHALRHLLGGGGGAAPLDDTILKAAYTALIKLWHLGYARWKQSRATDANPFDQEAYFAGVQKLINAAFYPAKPVYRGEDGRWYHTDKPGSALAPEGRATIIADLPPAWFINGEGELKPRKTDAAYLSNNGPAGRLGYTPLRVLGAVDAFGLIGNVERVGTVAPFIVPMSPPFRYRPPDERERPIALTTTERYLSTSFPKINPPALKLAMAAMMFAQLPEPTEPIRVMFVGQSGAAKTTTIKLAASFLGVDVSTVQFNRDRDKWLRAVSGTVAKGGVVLTDECAKSGVPATEMEALILAVQKKETYHELYHGTASLPVPGVHFFADTKVPEPFRDSDQLARRTYVVQLEAGAVGADWLASSGGYDSWRSRDPLGAEVADRIVSEVRDAVRAARSFEKYAMDHGFRPLDKQPAKDYDRLAPLRDLSIASLRVSERRGGRWSGPGWRVFNPRVVDSDDGPLVEAWRELEDERGVVDEQRITGCQWGNVANVPGLVCDFQPHGRKIGIRFRVGSERGSSTLFGIDVLPANHKLREKIAAMGSSTSVEADGGLA